MIVAQLIDYAVPNLKPSDSVGTAIEWLQEYHVNALVVLNQQLCVGIVDLDFLEQQAEGTLLEDIQLPYSDIKIQEDKHIFEAMALLARLPIKTIPVFNEMEQFVGVITATNVYNNFAKQLGVQEKGAVLEIHIKNKDYSLAEISRLIESNNAKILSSFFNSELIDEVFSTILTIKLNISDVSAIVATLERFGYIVVAAYANEPVDSLDQVRYDLLMRYLSV